MTGPRVAVVTGAARGIGAAVVAGLVRDGLHVVAVDACEDDPALGYHLASKEDLAAVEAAGDGRAHAVVADVRDVAALRDVVHDAVRDLGGLDVAVAAAGAIAGGRPLWETTAAEFDVLMDVSVRGVWNLAAAPGSTRTVMLEATAGIYGLPGPDALADRQLLGRLLEADEVAESVRWLCSPTTAAVTGSVLHTDGGSTS